MADEPVNSIKYTPFKRAKTYAPSKKDVDKIGKNVFGNKFVKVPGAKRGKTEV